MSVETSSKFDYDAQKPAWYFDGARHDFVDALRTGPDAAVLEIGCAAGGTGALALETGKAGRYAGIDIAPEAAAAAREKISEAHSGNVETMDLPWAPDSFDALIISEVLEHLVDPWALLSRLSPLLKPGAQILASSPNAAHLTIVKQLINGRFDLEDTGAMDRTHLRWFTPATYAEMFEGAGFVVERTFPLDASYRRKPKVRLLRALTGDKYDHLFWYQIVLHAVKPA